MSDENKTSGGEKKDVDGFFDSLIEDFTAEQSGDPSESSTPTEENDPPRTMRDFPSSSMTQPLRAADLKAP